MKEQRLYKRHTARLPSILEAIIPSGKKKMVLHINVCTIFGHGRSAKQW
jgi:hypothetical protein